MPPGASGASSGRCTPVATSTTTMCRYPRGPRRASTKRPSAETAVTERKPPRASVRCSPRAHVDEDDVGVRPVARGDRADVVIGSGPATGEDGGARVLPREQPGVGAVGPDDVQFGADRPAGADQVGQPAAVGRPGDRDDLLVRRRHQHAARWSRRGGRPRAAGCPSGRSRRRRGRPPGTARGTRRRRHPRCRDRRPDVGRQRRDGCHGGGQRGGHRTSSARRRRAVLPLVGAAGSHVARRDGPTLPTPRFRQVSSAFAGLIGTIRPRPAARRAARLPGGHRAPPIASDPRSLPGDRPC